MKSFLLLFILFSIVCYADIEMTPSQVLNEAKNVARNTSFSAKMTSSVNGQNISFMYYKSVNANGTIFTLMKPIEKKLKPLF